MQVGKARLQLGVCVHSLEYSSAYSLCVQPLFTPSALRTTKIKAEKIEKISFSSMSFMCTLYRAPPFFCQPGLKPSNLTSLCAQATFIKVWPVGFFFSEEKGRAGLEKCVQHGQLWQVHPGDLPELLQTLLFPPLRQCSTSMKHRDPRHESCFILIRTILK